MAKSCNPKRKKAPKTVLKLPDLEQSTSAVLNSLVSSSSQRSYDHAIREFIEWHCSEPRLAFNKTVVTRYRIALEQKHYAPSTINLRLAAVRRLAYEASDSGLLSPDLAAGIRRVKGVRRLGVKIGNWLTAEEGRRLLSGAGTASLKERRNNAMLAVLAGCGLRRAEAAALKIEDLQLREGHWVLADLNGKGGHIRTVPVPDWVKTAIDQWAIPASIISGTLFRSINKAGRVWGTGFTPKVIWSIVKQAASNSGLSRVAPHDLRRTCAKLCHEAGGELEQIQFLLGANHRALLGMQTTLSQCSERSHRPRTGLIMIPWSIIPCRLPVTNLATLLEAQVATISPWIRRIKDTLTRTCWRLRCCSSRIPSDPGADLLSCTVNFIGDSGHSSGQGCRIGSRLLMQSFLPCQTVQS